jgi:hypothetical protein
MNCLAKVAEYVKSAKPGALFNVGDVKRKMEAGNATSYDRQLIKNYLNMAAKFGVLSKRDAEWPDDSESYMKVDIFSVGAALVLEDVANFLFDEARHGPPFTAKDAASKIMGVGYDEIENETLMAIEHYLNIAFQFEILEILPDGAYMVKVTDSDPEQQLGDEDDRPVQHRQLSDTDEADEQTVPAISLRIAMEDRHLHEDEVRWVVNDYQELGVKIHDQFFWLQDGESKIYRPGTGPKKWRYQNKSNDDDNWRVFPNIGNKE